MVLALAEETASANIAEVQPTARGHHKVFLGMAAGVGKTYQMLREGQAEAESGRDVVIGYLEPHGRAETSAQADGLEVVPRRRVVYRDSVLACASDLGVVVAEQPRDTHAHAGQPGTVAQPVLGQVQIRFLGRD